MSNNIPEELRYTPSHEWLRQEEDDVVAVGITDNAQHLLGDLVFVELPEVGQTLQQEDECGVIESVKAASDVYCPLNGTITEVNEALVDAPEKINRDPYGEGWIFKMKVTDSDDMTTLLSAADYQERISAEED